MSVCTSINKVSEVNGTDLLEVTIDNTTVAYWFYPLADSMEFLNQEVIVEYRKDIYNGELRQFIKTFTMPTRVNVLDKKETFRLYLDQTDNQANVSFNEIADGESRPGCIVYCTAQEYKASTKATWMELLIRDRSMHVATLRLFDYENREANFEGQYIFCELSKSKYGFQTDRVDPAGGTVTPNPEIDIAQQYIQNYFCDDIVAMDFINKLDFFNKMREHIDYERGYSLVRLADELSICNALSNITNDVNLKTVGHALLTSYGYLTTNAVFSAMVNNINTAARFAWEDRRAVCLCLDDMLEEHIPEYYTVKQIKGMVDEMLKQRKGSIE